MLGILPCQLFSTKLKGGQMKIEIKTFAGKVLYSCEALSVKECLEQT